MKKNLFFPHVLFLLVFLSGQSGFTQNQVNPPKSKTAVYLIKKQPEQQGLSATQAIDIDKLLTSKKGILSSVTNAATRRVTVTLENNFPEVEIAKLLTEVLKLEVESYQVPDTEHTK